MMKRSKCILILALFIVACQKEGEADFGVKSNLTMAIFGGSYTVIPEANVCKICWQNEFGLMITDYGVRGAGFSTLSLENNIPSQVDMACADGMPVYDIYLLWASTNDYRKCNDKPGTVSDFSAEDGYSLNSLETQCGGINYCIKKIKDKAPEASILFFSSSPIFTSEKDYSTEYNEADGMKRFVSLQAACCKKHQVPFLDQFNDSPLTIENWQECFQTDGIHLNESGYTLLLEKQMPFMEEQIKCKIKK